MELRSGKVKNMSSKPSSPMQPVTSRMCVIPFCENSEQLINICCKNCEDKKFCQKHYMCMGCYLHLLHTACTQKRNPVCPLDRSELLIDPMLKRMVEGDVLMESFWTGMERAAAEFTTVRNLATPQQGTPSVRVGPRRRVRLYRQHAIHPTPPSMGNFSFPPSSPPGIPNVREAMEEVEEIIVIPDTPPSAEDQIEFPYWDDNDENVNPEVVNSIIRDLDDEAANGFHDPNA